MLRGHACFQIDIREKLARPPVRTPHPSLPVWPEYRNHIRQTLSARPNFSSLLGIIYQAGGGAPANIDDATNYYLIAEQSGYSMATYRLGGIYNKRGELRKAYDSYQATAQNNPSAAYWAYRLLALDNNLDTNPNASDKYLNIAAEQGHVLAQRIIAMKYISGGNGFLKIPYGFYLFLKMAWSAIRVTSEGEKLKYD
jgi:TPR repeat protein